MKPLPIEQQPQDLNVNKRHTDENAAPGMNLPPTKTCGTDWARLLEVRLEACHRGCEGLPCNNSDAQEGTDDCERFTR